LKKIDRLIKKHGKIVFLKLLFSPIILLFTTPLMMLKLWWNCRFLLFGKIDKYHRFSGIPAINCFFYWTQALNLEKFGSNGVSNFIGLGKFELSKFFYVPKFGNYLFWKFSTIVSLISFTGFSISHSIWMINSANNYPIYVSIIILFSVLLYSCIDRVNYNCLGWLWFPIFIWSIDNNNMILSLISTGFIGFFSITVGVFSFILSLVYFVSYVDFKYLYFILPLVLIALYRMYPAFKCKTKKNSDNTFLNILKQIGVFTNKVKYRRSKKISIFGIYFTIFFTLYLFIALYQSNWKFNEYLTTLSIFILLLILGQSSIFRFADSHSYLISTWSVTAAYTICAHDPVVLGLFVLVSNPIPLFGLFCTNKLPILCVPERKPIYVGNAISKVCNFLSDINVGEKILFQFDNPSGSYNKIFDGYRNLYELLLYCGNLQNLHILPDWYLIQESNTEDGLELWGRNLSDVFISREKFHFNYFIAYENDSNPLADDFCTDPRIHHIHSLNLSCLTEDFSPDPPNGMDGDTLVLHLYTFK